MMKVLVLSALALMVTSTLAVAQTATPPLSEVIRGLEDKGYVVTDVDVGSRDIEVEATKEGVKYDIDLSLTGEVLREERDL